MYHGRVDEASTHFDTALKLNPADATARAIYGFHLTKIGQSNAACEQFAIARELDPYEQSWVPWIRAKALYAMRDYTHAIEELLRANHAINDVRLWLAASYAQIGQLDDACAQLSEFLDSAEREMPLFPGRKLECWLPFLDEQCNEPDDLHHFQQGLRLAWPGT